MSVSAGTGGTSVVSVVVGAGAATHSNPAAPVLSSLPYTGASHMMTLVAVALVLLVTGVLALGLVRRVSDGDAP